VVVGLPSKEEGCQEYLTSAHTIIEIHMDESYAGDKLFVQRWSDLVVPDGLSPLNSQVQKEEYTPVIDRFGNAKVIVNTPNSYSYIFISKDYYPAQDRHVPLLGLCLIKQGD
jgi:hypothetical protein